MDFDFMSINEILNLVKKKWKLLIILPLITTLIAFVFSFYLIKPKYKGYTKVFIGKEETQDNLQKYNNDDVSMYMKLLKTYSEIIRTNSLVTKALKSGNINLTSHEVLSGLTCVPTDNTQILVIQYENSNRDLAEQVLTSVTLEFMNTARELIPNGTVKIVEDIVIPSYPTSPNKKLNLIIGFAAGVILSLGIIFLIEFIDDTFKTKEKLERLISLPVLGLIPDDFEVIKSINKNSDSSSDNKLILESARHSIVAESYRTLQTNIKYSSLQTTIHTLLVTSAQLQEGKSTVASNLALSFAENNNKVLVIDCNLRNPTLHKQFNISNEYGLSDLISTDIQLDDALHKHSTYLYILTAGKSTETPASIFSSPKMDELLSKLKNDFDIIILDSAPVLSVTDSQILSTKTDGTLLVVHYGMSTIKSVIGGRDLIKMVGGNIIGSVLYSTELKKADNDYYYANITASMNS